MTNILRKKRNEHLDEFAFLCQEKINVDAKLIKNYALQLIKYYSSNNKQREILRIDQDLENRWYQSLEKGTPDYSVYAEKKYNSDMFACWTLYSRKYILNLEKMAKDKKLEFNSILDLGCGAGFTTIALKQLFPKARVVGTNLEGTEQIKLCRHHALINKFYIETDYNKLKETDFIFASEYFEHIENPVEHLEFLLNKTKPKMLMIANAFSAKSLGHFNFYNHHNQKIENKKIGRIFNQTLRNYGYKQVKTGWWNNRPALWIKN